MNLLIEIGSLGSSYGSQGNPTFSDLFGTRITVLCRSLFWCSVQFESGELVLNLPDNLTRILLSKLETFVNWTY